MNIAHNIYIHVPFCLAKCRYCAFFSRACANPNWDEYADNIISELIHFGRLLDNPTVPTIFFGGGTPSLMPTEIFQRIMNAIFSNFNVVQDAEITLEANPGTLNNQKLDEFCDIGVNRLSIGVQSFNNEKLQFLGRIHTAQDALSLIEHGQKKGIRISADFIYGIPGDTVQDVIDACQKINKIGLTHCSMYELTIEPNTPFGKIQLDMPDNNVMADMYSAISATLDLPRYEVSNYAYPGQECRHNQNVWDGDAYIGIGNGAAGRVFLDGTWYEELGANKLFAPMTNESRAIERVITGLRTKRGVKMDSETEKIIDIGFAKLHPDMLTFRSNRMMATDAGILVLDDLITKLVK